MNSDKNTIGFKEQYPGGSDAKMFVYRVKSEIYNRFDNATREEFYIYNWVTGEKLFYNMKATSRYIR